MLLQLLDRILDYLEGLGCKSHIINKDRQDETNITLDIDINSYIRRDLGEAHGFKNSAHLMIPVISTLFCGIECFLQQADEFFWILFSKAFRLLYINITVNLAIEISIRDVDRP